MSANQAHVRLLLAAAVVVLLVFAFGRRDRDEPGSIPPAAADHNQLVLRQAAPLAVATASRPADATTPVRARRPAGSPLTSHQLVKLQPVSGQPPTSPIRSVAAQEPKTNPPPVRKVRYHRVVEGDTLQDIARHYLGAADRFVDIFEVNRDVLTRPDLLPLGVRLVIPPRLVPVPPAPVASPVPRPSGASLLPTAIREQQPAAPPAPRVLSDRELLPVPP